MHTADNLTRSRVPPAIRVDAIRMFVRERTMLLLLSVPALFCVLLVLVAPLAWLTGLSFFTKAGALTFENYIRIFGDGSYAKSFWLTTWVALLVTAICAVLGYPLAYAISLMPSWASRICLALVAIPFWTSVLVRTYAWLILLQNEGVVNRLLLKFGLIETPIRMMYNMTGNLVGMVHILLPFLVFPLYAGLRRIDPDYVKAGLGLGASRTYAFWRIYFPLSVPGLVAGAVLVFILSLGFYITPALLGGGKIIVIPLVLERDITWSQDWGPATAASVVFVGAILVIFSLLARFMSLERLFAR
jgi:ABC-type spermidine/putrescine transport system permease subunit I